MNITITITDATQLLGLQRALDLQNTARSTPLTAEEFIQGMVINQVNGFVATNVVTRISPFDFLSRFTAAERAAIRTAAQTNGTLADYIGMVGAAPVVVLTDTLTTTGVNELEAAGLIAPGRAAQILAL
jgi:hypothetical protein